MSQNHYNPVDDFDPATRLFSSDHKLSTSEINQLLNIKIEVHRSQLGLISEPASWQRSFMQFMVLALFTTISSACLVIGYMYFAELGPFYIR